MYIKKLSYCTHITSYIQLYYTLYIPYIFNSIFVHVYYTLKSSGRVGALGAGGAALALSKVCC